MPKSASDLALNFQSRLISLEKIRKKTENFYIKRLFVLKDIDHVYTGLFFDAYTAFEKSIEDLFFGLLTGRYRLSSKKFKAKIHFPSEALAREILHSDKQYLEWLPYSKTKERSLIYFRDGHPFNGLSDGQISMMKEMSIVRNYIAHNSNHSKEQFKKKVIGNMKLLPREKTARGFLRSVYSTSPNTTRLELYFGEMASILKDLCI